MPWKLCPHCYGWSYSAATNSRHWICPYCHRDIAAVREVERPPHHEKKSR